MDSIDKLFDYKSRLKKQPDAPKPDAPKPDAPKKKVVKKKVTAKDRTMSDVGAESGKNIKKKKSRLGDIMGEIRNNR